LKEALSVAVETTKQIIQENPEIEAYRLGLLQSVQQFINENLGQMPPPPITPPAYQIAGLSPMQQQAAQLAQRGIGAYQPYLEAGLGAMRTGEEIARTTGLGGLQEGFGFTRGAAQGLRGVSEQYQPSMAQSFMNPYEEQVVQQAMRDIAREGQIREQGLQAQAAASGAFGGSRQAVAEQELARNVLEQQARTGGQLRAAGYQQASQQAQLGQFGQGIGSLAQAGSQLGGQLSTLGLQQAGLGQLGQQLGLQDIKTLEAMGARDQALQQAVLDAQRQSNLQLYQLPYQQYSFLSDIYKGTPSSQQVTQISQQQDPSTFQQIAGLGIAGLSAAGGAKQLGMFS
jgi:hypothetical protein